MKFAGIDYSLRGPAVCIFEGNKRCCFKDCTFHFLTKTKRLEGKHLSNIYGTLMPEWEHECQRYQFISEWAFNLVRECDKVMIEDYAYSATGRVFNIGENTGLLKWKMWRSQVDYDVTPPSVIKKFGSGRGNAGKKDMYDSFLKDTKMDLREELTPTTKNIKSPVSDIVDAFYICKYLHSINTD